MSEAPPLSAPPSTRRVTFDTGTGNGVQPAMDRAQARAFSLSATLGNRRRNSIASGYDTRLERNARPVGEHG